MSTSSSSQVEEYAPFAHAQAKLKSTFKTPSIINRSAFIASGGLDRAHEPPSAATALGPSKRRKILPDGTYANEVGYAKEEGDGPAGPSPKVAVVAPARTPVSATRHVSTGSSNNGGKKAQVWECTYRKPQYKKHKTWDGDAYLVIYTDKNLAILRDMSTQQEVARTGNWNKGELDEDVEYTVGGKEIQVSGRIAYADYIKQIDREKHANRADSGSQKATAAAAGAEPLAAPISTASTASYLHETTRNFQAPARVRSFYAQKKKVEEEEEDEEEEALLKQAKKEQDRDRSKRSMSPVKVTTGLQNPGQGRVPHARYSTETEGAILMKRPDKEHQKEHNKDRLPIVDVVIDPNLGKHLRPHQIEGVKFLYECVMGMSEKDHYGAILADEMGLGKTLQTITLIHTLLKQNCYYRPASYTIQKALIVCPLSLVKNWYREFKKWLGNSSINILCIDGDKRSNVRSFLYSKTYSVMIIGYEKLRTCMNELKDAQPPIDLIVCDEGHRLKSKDAKTTKMFDALSCRRRIILSGTPIQNDLSEFYAMVDFVCPELLGDRNTFKKVFEDPIVKSRAQHCRKEDLEAGKHRSQMLQTVTQKIILRRTADLLSDYLKPKTEMVVFCAPSQLQLDIYRQLVGTKSVQRELKAGTFSNPLPYILALRKLCNSPWLLQSDVTETEDSTVIYSEECKKLLNSEGIARASNSGKLTALDKLVKTIRTTTDDKIVIVSNFTTTLDVIEALCDRRDWSCLRLDGKTRTDQRQELVNQFNRESQASSFIFLLSAKSGGVGLNLIGANRLILFDSDWNPSTDKQAMARIHRDGQKKPCFIYRMLLAGTMDEKIYQRQLSKIGLSDSLMDADGKSSKASDSFTKEELKDIFTLHTDTCSLTHQLLRCDCGGTGKIVIADPAAIQDEDDGDDDSPLASFIAASQVDEENMSKASKDKRAKLAALFTWGHFDCWKNEALQEIKDDIVKQVARKQYGTSSAVPSSSKAAADKQKSLLERLDDPDVMNSQELLPSGSAPFDRANARSGTILHVFEKNSKSLPSDTPQDSCDEGA